MPSVHIMLATLSLACVASASEIRPHFYNGHKLVEWMKSDEKCDKGEYTPKDLLNSRIYIAFIAGVIDATDDLGDPNLQLGQAKKIVTEFLRANPDRWSESAAVLVQNAISKNGG
jgi:hypothetical protein